MKRGKCFWIIFLLITLLFFVVSNISAINTPFSVEEKSSEEQEQFISNIGFVALSSEPERTSFVCFDVNESHMIAVGFDIGEKKQICVYSPSGEFQYGYRFNCSGSFGVEWDKTSENLFIYFVRSDVAIEVTPQGEIIAVCEILNTKENNSHWIYSVSAKERVVGDKRYIAKNNMGFLNFFASSYSQLSVESNTGETVTIIDNNSSQLVTYIAGFVGIILFAIVVISGVLRGILKSQGENTRHNSMC